MNELLGIDMSKWQRHVAGKPPAQGIDKADFDKIVEKGPLSFAINRVSLGLSDRDESALKHLRWFNKASVWSGAYHFLTGGEDGWTQANNFLGALTSLRASGIGIDFVVCDIEDGGTKYREVCEFLARFRHQQTGAMGIYSRESYLSARKDTEFQKVERLFDFSWWADYRSADGRARRFLSDWHTSPKDEKFRPDVMWQWGPLRFVDPDDPAPDGGKAWDSVDGNVFLGSHRDFAEFVGVL